MKNLSVLDADACAYILTWKYQDVSTQEMQGHVSQWVENILSATQADYYLGFVGGVGNFRKEVAVTKPYKGTRKEEPESVAYWKPIIKSFLVNHWGFVECHGIEADDACSIAHTLYSQDYFLTICGCDHDLLQLPGKHFNYQKGVMQELTSFQASYNFHHQLLTGCSGDEVPGLRGIGPAKATKILASETLGLTPPEAVRQAYLQKGCEEAYYQEQYTLLKLLEDGTPYGFTCPSPIPVPVSSPVVEVSIDHLFV